MISGSTRLWSARRGLLVASFATALAGGGCRCGGPGIQHVTSEGKVLPSAIDFGTVTLGQTVKQKFTIQNVGAVSLNVDPPAFSGANATDFVLSPTNDGIVLAPGQTWTGYVAFAPGDAGPRQGSLVLTTNSRTTPTLTIALTGLGVDIKLCPAPPALDFGLVQILGTPAQLTLVINNCGRSPADMSLGALEGPNAGDFAINGTTTTTLQPGQALTVTVAYSPSVVGPSIADIPLKPCGACALSPPITIGGVGIDGALTLTPNPVTFGILNAGQSATTTVTATNTGTAAVIINQLLVAGAPTGPFSLVSPPATPLTLAPAQSTTLTVKFMPTTGGAVTDELQATWSVADLAVAARGAVDPLEGNSIQTPCTLAIAPNPLNFGNVSLNNSSIRKVNLTNSGEQICNISGIAMGAGTDPEFTLTFPGTATTVPPGGTTPISVTFKPINSNPPLNRKGTLVFQSDDPARANVSVPLSGNVNNTIYTGGWPKWHLDNFNSGQTLADTSGLAGTVGWKFPVGAPNAGTFMHSPVVDGSGNVYFVGNGGMLYSVSSTNTKLWQLKLNDPGVDEHPPTPVLLADGTMFVAFAETSRSNPSLYLINATAGSITSSINYYNAGAGEGFSSTPALGNDGTLFQLDDDGMPNNGGGDPFDAICFKNVGGTITQTAAFQINFNSANSDSERASIVIAADNTSYWCSGNQCYGMKPPPGFTPLAAWPATGTLFANPSAQDPNANGFSTVSDVAMDSAPGGYLFAYAGWSTTVNGNPGVGGALAALNPANGQVVWALALPPIALANGATQTSADFGNASPAVASDGTVYVGNGDGLRAVNGTTGVVKWLFKSADVTDAPAIGADGTVFFGTKDGNFYAVNPDGTLRFKIQSGGQISAAPAIANDGSVYFVSDDGNLYAVH